MASYTIRIWARTSTFKKEDVYDFKLEQTKDKKVLWKKLKGAVEKGEKASLKVEVSNTDRAFGSILGSEITSRYKNGLPEDTITLKCTGAGGQSFGAFIPKGLSICLTGDCNDYMGKGLSGGKITVTAPAKRTYKAEDNIIIGNVALYGATSGEVHQRCGRRAFCSPELRRDGRCGRRWRAWL